MLFFVRPKRGQTDVLCSLRITQQCFQSVGPSARWEDHMAWGVHCRVRAAFLPCLCLCVLPGLYLGCDCHVTSRAQECSGLHEGRTVRQSKEPAGQGGAGQGGASTLPAQTSAPTPRYPLFYMPRTAPSVQPREGSTPRV